MMKKDYKIAIPSYKRAETLRDKTLTTLSQYNLNPEQVYIFVANEEEHAIYTETLKDLPYKNIIIGEVGMGAIRRFIQGYFADGDYVVNFDDDLSAIERKFDDKTLIPVKDIEKEIFEVGFNACEKTGSHLWGIYAANNPMFMNNRVSIGLYYCIGSFWGCINRRSSDVSVSLDDKEDFERTLLYYVKDYNVVRLDYITVSSKYYTEEGGMQVERTTERIEKSAFELAKRYPTLAQMYKRETTGHMELRLRDSKDKKGLKKYLSMNSAT